MELLIVRHGTTRANREQRFQGRLDTAPFHLRKVGIRKDWPAGFCIIRRFVSAAI